MQIRVALLSLLLTAAPASAVTLQPGDVLVNQGFVARVLPGGGAESIVPFTNPLYPTELTVAAGTPYAAVSRLAAPIGSRIYRIDAATSTAVPVSPVISSDDINELVGSDDGLLYALDGAAPGGGPDRLYRIDPATQSVTLLFENTATTGPLAGVDIRGMGLLDSNTALFTFGNPSTGSGGGLYSYDLTTGATALVTTITSAFGLEPTGVTVSASGRVFVSQNGSCFGSPCNNVIEVDLGTGSSTIIGGGTNNRITDIETNADGSLVYFTQLSGSSGPPRLFRIDTVAGTTTQIPGLTLGITDAGPAAVAIVPEPGTAWLVALGVLGVGGSARRRRGRE